MCLENECGDQPTEGERNGEREAKGQHNDMRKRRGWVAMLRSRAAVRFLTWDLWLYQKRQLRQRFLPTEIARLDRDNVWDTVLDDLDLGTNRYRTYHHGCCHFPGEIRIVESCCPLYALVGDELDVCAPKRMTVTRGEIGERHAISAPFLRLELLEGSGEAVGG